MKKIILISALAALCLGCAVSCSGILDQTQTDKIATANMWTSPERAAAGIRGLYRPFYRDETDRLSNGAQLNYHRWWKNGAYGGYCWNFSEAIGFPTDYRTGGWPLWYLSSEGKTADEFFIGGAIIWRTLATTPSPTCTRRAWTKRHTTITSARPGSCGPSPTST